MPRILTVVACTVVAVAAALAGRACANASATPVIGAYYPGYAAARYPVASIPAGRLTHLFYAFAHIDNGQCAVDTVAGEHFAALAQLKREHPELRTLISIGGWDADGFSDAALTADSRKRFVDSCVSMFFDRYRGSFDGVDIDWEFPVSGGPPKLKARPEDRRNMTSLAREFRRRLDALGDEREQKYLVTAALPAGRLQFGGAYDPARSFDLPALARTLDFINLMTYDMGTSALSMASLNAPLREDPRAPMEPSLRRSNTVEGAIDDYIRRGVPARSLVLGVPFHGRGYRVATDAHNGLYQPVSGYFDPGDWRTIRATLLSNPQWQQHWQPAAQAPWLFEPQERIFVSYEDPRSIEIRAKLAKKRGLRGVFMWELTGDDDRQSLLHAMTQPFAR